MIPMRQLHVPIYDRAKMLDSIGSEEAVNAIGVEFTKHAPEIITKLEVAFSQNDYNTMQLLSLKLATIAHSSGAKQISEFAKTVFKEVSSENEEDLHRDTVVIAIACIKNSMKEFVTLLNDCI